MCSPEPFEVSRPSRETRKETSPPAATGISALCHSLRFSSARTDKLFSDITKKQKPAYSGSRANGSEANFSPQEKRRRTAGRLNASGRVICPGEQHSAAKHHDIANIYLTALHRIRLLFHLLYSNLMVSFCAYLPTMSIGYWKYYQKYISHLTEITLC